MNLNDLFTEEKVRLDPKCWTGKKIGNPKTKMKGGTRVNNCVPAESVNEMDKSQTPPGRDGSNDSDAGKKEYTAKVTTPKKVAKHGEEILNKVLNKKQGMAEGYQLDEGAVETITALVKKIPGIGKYYQMAQQYKPQLIEILKTSKSGKEVKQKMEQLAAGQSATVAESGMMKQLGGLAVGGGSILSTMWMNAMGMIDGVLAHAAAGEVGGAVASGSILGLIPVTLMLFAAMLLFKGSKQSSDEKAQAFQAQRGQQGVAEEYELAGVGVAYELGRRAYKQGMTIRDNPYSATREARKNDEWAKGLERGEHDANDARHFRSSVREKLGDNRPKLGSKRDSGKSIRKWRKSRGLDETGQVNEKSVSQAQFRTMAAAAHNPKFARKVGISQDVAREFNKADKGQDYKKLPARTTEGSLEETDTSRRGFLRGLAAFAASAAVPAPVVKLLSTPAGVASLPIPAGIALLKGIQEHLDQWDPEDDDDYYEAWEDMAGELGFEDEDAGDEYGESAQDKLADIVNLYRENPELAAAQLIQHLQTNVGVSPKEIKPSLGSRADNPNDWRYHDKQKGDADAGKKESELEKLTRLAAAAQRAANANFEKSAAAAAVKHMGPVQYAKDTPALPAPTKPEFDLAPDLKQKEKVPVGQQYKKDNQQGMGEGEQKKGADYRDPPEADYGDDYQDMVARVKKLAGLGPMKTVYDPNKRVYRNIPTAVQPKK